ncbi:acetate--CoA ligase family protein [Chloroflexota bacterium]
MNHFETIFNPESVAVVGASNNLEKWGGGVFNSVLRASSIKRIYPVNKNSPEVQGVKTYPTVRDLPEKVDFVVIVIPFPDVPDIVRDCVEMEVKAALIITAGLGETGGHGAELQEEIVRTAKKSELRLIGPNCMGHFNTANGFSTVRMGLPIDKGEIGIISESGGFSAHILQCGTEMGVGFSKFVSTGNEADLHFEDFFEYLAQDDDTRVITAYIEGLREGRRFFNLAKDITRKKPVVVVKVGKTEAGAKAARSHTSAIAGSDRIYDAVFKQTGVIRVDEVEELFDVASALLRQPLPRGNRVGILTFGGGFGCVASDACERLGLDVAPLSPHTIERLNEVLPDRWPHANPVDTVGYGFVTYPCLWPLMEDDGLDALLVIGGIGQMGMRGRRIGRPGPPPDQQPEEQAFIMRQKEEQKNINQLFEYMDRYQKPVIIFNRRATAIKDRQGNSLPTYSTPDRAAKVLAHLVEYSRYLNSL